jgi:hypothetical protein
MNRAVHSAAAQQRCVGSIHDSLNLLLRDVTLNHFDPSRYRFVRHVRF